MSITKQHTANIITIDGPASSGKGTVARKLSEILGFNYLDSGAIYRSLGFILIKNHISADNTPAIIKQVEDMTLIFRDKKVLLNGEDVTEKLRMENIGMMASLIGKIPQVREGLLDFQRSFAIPPGLVTDGRDMGSVVFPNACLKIFLTASAEKRALRRFSQLQDAGNSVTIGAILRDIEFRDMQDQNRLAAPLAYDNTFKVLDNSEISAEETVQTILFWYRGLSGK